MKQNYYSVLTCTSLTNAQIPILKVKPKPNLTRQRIRPRRLIGRQLKLKLQSMLKEGDKMRTERDTKCTGKTITKMNM